MNEDEKLETNLNDDEEQEMPANEIREQLFRAIDAIVENRIMALGFDKTVIATIINSTNAREGIYTVTTDDNITFDAYSDQINLYDNLQVYVRIPQGDYTKRKFITNLYEPLEVQQKKNAKLNMEVQLEVDKVIKEFRKDILSLANDCAMNDSIDQFSTLSKPIVEQYKKQYSLLALQIKEEKNGVLPSFTESIGSDILNIL